MEDSASVQNLRDSLAAAFAADKPPTVQTLRDSIAAAFSQRSGEITAGTKVAIEESPLTGEALLTRPEINLDGPEMVQANNIPVSSGPRSLAALLEGYQSASPLDSSASVSASCTSDKQRVDVTVSVTPKEEEEEPLKANFIVDVTVPDGQVLPPGAEFMKCWRMVNSGARDWPESTELTFLAGMALARDQSVTSNVKIGSVKVGDEVDLWTGELKAPDAPGRYVSYWRLKDEDGLFGANIWLDITVAETGQLSNDSSESSMTSSSVIIMPQLNSVANKDETSSQRSSSAAVTAPSNPRTVSDYAASEAGSDTSLVSLVSMPASSEEDWEDSRTNVHVAPSVAGRSAGDGTLSEEAEEYVVLYDDSSSEEE